MSDSPYVINVTEENFQSVVIEGSMNLPVLVDFWADWCNPCKMLIPIVTKLAEEYDGKFILAKINTDEQQPLAVSNGVKSLPTVKMFKNGEAVDEFMGALPESEVRAFIDKHVTNESDNLYDQAMLAYHKGDIETALPLLNQALAREPDNAQLKYDIAKIIAEEGELDSAKALINSMSPEQQNEGKAKELMAQISLQERLGIAPDASELELRIQTNGEDFEAYLLLSDVYIAQGEIEKSLDLLLSIMTKDRTFNDDAGRKGLINSFDLLGLEHPLAKKYRRKMFSLMH